MPSASDATTGFAAVAAATRYVGIAGFQAALAAGAPLGLAVWGGGSTNLGTGYRIACGFAVVLWLLAAAVVLERGGVRRLAPRRGGRAMGDLVRLRALARRGA